MYDFNHYPYIVLVLFYFGALQPLGHGSIHTSGAFGYDQISEVPWDDARMQGFDKGGGG